MKQAAHLCPLQHLRGRDMPFDKRLPTEGYGPTDLGIQAGV